MLSTNIASRAPTDARLLRRLVLADRYLKRFTFSSRKYLILPASSCSWRIAARNCSHGSRRPPRSCSSNSLPLGQSASGNADLDADCCGKGGISDRRLRPGLIGVRGYALRSKKRGQARFAQAANPDNGSMGADHLRCGGFSSMEPPK